MKKFLTTSKLFIVLSVGIVTSSCGGGSGGNPAALVQEDATTSGELDNSNTGNPDSGTSDSGTPDSGTSDSGTSDSDTSDSGTSDSDTSDSGTSDSGTSGSENPDNSGLVVDSNNSTVPPEDEQSNTSDDAAFSIWRISDVPGDIEPLRYEVNSKRQFGGTGYQMIDAETFTRRVVVFLGTLDGFKPILNIGDTLPGERPNTVIESFESTTLAPDGSMSITARLTGARPGFALLIAQGDALRVVARTGEMLSPVNGEPFEVRQLTSLALDQGRTVFSARPEGVEDYLIMLDDGEDVRIVAATRDTLLGEAGRPRSEEIDCEIGATDGSLGSSLDYLFDYERATLLDDGSIVFQAFHNRECDWGESIVRYNNDTYNIVVADGQPVPGASDATFRRGAKLIATPRGGRMVVNVGVTREKTNENPAFGLISGSKTIWEFSLDESPKLVVAQGESLQTPTAQYFLDSQVFNAPSLNFTYGNDNQYVMRGVDLGDGDETAVFVGRPREPVYTAYESVGASSLEYRIGSLDFLPEPYTKDNFLTGLKAIRVFNDGRLLFLGNVADASVEDSESGVGLWTVDSSNTISQIIEPGNTYATVNGDPIELLWVDIAVDYDNGFLQENGSIGFIFSVIGSDVYVEVQ